MSFLDADSLHEFIGPIAARFREEHGRLPNPRNEEELALFLESFTVEEEESFLEFLIGGIVARRALAAELVKLAEELEG